MLKNISNILNKKTMIASSLAIASVFFGMQSEGNAQYYNAAYYQPAATSYYQPQQRISTVPSYGKSATRRRTEYNRYQSSEAFDTLADTGMYLGISFAKGTSTGDRMQSEFCDTNIPGNCSNANPADDPTTSTSFLVGMSVSSTTRLELNYASYSGMRYGNTATWSDGSSSISLPTQGGDINSTVFMASFYYTLDNLLGNFSGGRIVPYIGLGAGIAFNEVQSYTIFDDFGYDIDTSDTCFYDDVYEWDGSGWVPVEGGVCNYVSDGMITYAGKTTQDMAWMFELGATWKLQNQVFIDIFFRQNTLGRIETGTTVVSDYLETQYVESDVNDVTATLGQDRDATGDIEDSSANDVTIVEVQSPNVTANYGHKEKADITITEIGLKFRIMF